MSEQIETTEALDAGVFRATKRPVTIEAMRLTDTNAGAVVAWINGSGGKATMRGGPKGGSRGASVIVTTLEGREVGEPGYVFIKGVRGEFYPCEGDIFAETYTDRPDTPAPAREEHRALGWDDLKPFEREQGGYWLYWRDATHGTGENKTFVRVTQPAPADDDREALRRPCDQCGAPSTRTTTPGAIRFCDEHGSRR